MSDQHAAMKLFISSLMIRPEGRTFIYNQLQSSLVFTNTFHPDPVTHAFNAGMRESGLRLEQQVRDAAPDLYIKMLEENHCGSE